MAVTGTDFKVMREKKIDKDTTLVIKKNVMNGRIFVEFTSSNPRIVLQKNFQDSYDGKNLSEAFAKSIKSTEQLRAYFGIKNKENR
jgi:hypothetical protein